MTAAHHSPEINSKFPTSLNLEKMCQKHKTSHRIHAPCCIVGYIPAIEKRRTHKFSFLAHNVQHLKPISIGKVPQYQSSAPCDEAEQGQKRKPKGSKISATHSPVEKAKERGICDEERPVSPKKLV